jgi:hypothetical protein
VCSRFSPHIVWSDLPLIARALRTTGRRTYPQVGEVHWGEERLPLTRISLAIYGAGNLYSGFPARTNILSSSHANSLL